MRLSRLYLSGSVAIALWSCEATDKLATAPMFSSSGAVVSSVTGSGHVPSGTGLRQFTFHAQGKADGSANGSYKIKFTASGLFLKVDVTCVAVVENTAWVGGTIVESNIGAVQIGTVSYFYAIDNGEGSNAPPDRVSIARINDVEGEDVRFCAERPLLLPSFDIANGNVQVH